MKENHPRNALSDIKIRKIKKAGRYSDGLGLHLWVTKSQTKQWVLRIMVRGIRRDIGLGGYPDVPLTEARSIRSEMRAQIRAGLDPIAHRNDAQRQIPTFAEAAKIVHDLNVAGWKNRKHGDQWISTLEKYAFPVVGKRRVDDITIKHISDVLEPIWITKHETANRVRQRMSKVFDWAKTKEFIKHENPVKGIKEGLPTYTGKPSHFKALSYTEINHFIRTLSESTQSLNVQLGLQFLILTACRSGELRFAKWEEIATDWSRWIVPANRMKNGIEHHIPLSKEAKATLEKIQLISGNYAFIFPSSQNWKKAMSDSTMSKAVKTLGFDVTVHGFRSTFRDWASETRTYPNDIVEMALAHTNPNKVEAAYKRGDLFDKRVEVMQDWANYCYAQDLYK